MSLEVLGYQFKGRLMRPLDVDTGASSSDDECVRQQGGKQIIWTRKGRESRERQDTSGSFRRCCGWSYINKILVQDFPDWRRLRLGGFLSTEDLLNVASNSRAD
jgi:hypothetical protein